MKKITLLCAMLLFSIAGFSQTLNQAASWPNATWTLSGTYDAPSLLSDPTTTANFSYNDDGAGSGGDDGGQGGGDGGNAGNEGGQGGGDHGGGTQRRGGSYAAHRGSRALHHLKGRSPRRPGRGRPSDRPRWPPAGC